MAMPTMSSACTVCMGDPEAPMTRGMIAGVGLLLGVTFAVLGCFGAFVVYLSRRSSLYHKSQGMLETA